MRQRNSSPDLIRIRKRLAVRKRHHLKRYRKRLVANRGGHGATPRMKLVTLRAGLVEDVNQALEDAATTGIAEHPQQVAHAPPLDVLKNLVYI